jgi:hypothetical protein
MKSSIKVRRAELIQQIAMERDAVAHSWSRTLHIVESFRIAANQARHFMHRPGVLVTLAVGIWMIGWNRGVRFLSHASLAWSAWRRVSRR